MIQYIKEHLRLNRTGKQSDRLTLDYIELAVGNYEKKNKKRETPKTEDRRLIKSYYAGLNPND